MFKSYLIIAINNLLKNKLFALINLVGLMIGLASTLLIGLFVLDELSYDQQYADSERIYRISRDFTGDNLFLASNAPQVAALLKQDFPEVEQSARLFGGQALLSRDEIAFYENNIRFADNSFFDIFKVEWIAGDPAHALEQPNTIVLTESIARKYFGSEQPIGQTLMIERAIPAQVTGIIRDLPHNTHLDLSVVVSMPTVIPVVGEAFFEDWANNSFYTYIRLAPGVNIDAVSSQFIAFMQRHFRENAEASTALAAMPLRDIHLRSTRQNEMLPPGSMSNVYVFSAVALFILLIACLNFMNLSTARSIRRGKEVGVRKALGASRGQVASQFVGESILLTVLASLLALVLVEVLLPYFNAFIGKDLAMNFFSDARVPLATLALIVVVGLVAGSYPAFFLSSFKPTQVLRSMLSSGGSVLLRNSLVVLQFSIAIVLVAATLVVVQQLKYARNFEQGFRKEQVLILKGPPTVGLGAQWATMREELLGNPEISYVTASSQIPLQVNTNTLGARPEGVEIDKGIGLPFMEVDYDFFATYEIPVLAGRIFSEEFPADRLRPNNPNGERTTGDGIVLNRRGAVQFGWSPEEAIGKTINIYVAGGPHAATVIGVVENSNFESVRSDTKPMSFIMPPYLQDNVASMPNASIRISGNNISAALAHIDSVWQRFLPEFPMERHFLDEDFATLYLAEDRQARIFYCFAMLAIFIACMGLYGLASFNAERRTKEIGVRKVMGGSVWSIVVLLTNDFSKLVLLSNLIAWPIAWFAMERWLSNFAYRIDLGPLVFVGSGLIALSIAWVTVGGTAAKAASAKPVLALRYE
ncbi:MAG: ABC transporter permease [Pseudomonadota bacterium]